MMRGVQKSVIATAVCIAAVAYVGSSAPADAKNGTSSTIVVGGQGDLSAFPGVAAGFQARIARFNRDGGLGGREIKFLGVLDDNLNPSTSAMNTQKLVLDDHVFADAPFESEICEAGQGTILEENRTPFVGLGICGAWSPTNRWGFAPAGYLGNPNVQANEGDKQIIEVTEEALHLPTPSKVKLALIGIDEPGNQANVSALTGVAKGLGATVVYSEASLPLEVTNYAPYVEAIVSSGANAVFEVLGTAGAVGLAAALKAANFKGVVANAVAYFPGQLADNPSEESALQGTYVTSTWPVEQNNSPASRQEMKDLKAIGQPNLGFGTSAGYWAADMLVEMLQATAAKYGAANVTPSKVQQVASHFTYVSSLKGGICPLSYPKDFDAPGVGYTTVQVEGSGYIEKIPLSCGQLIHVGSS
jgi:ABC-type branched-subunit amino acid transport system substrate-binding protein